MDFSKLDDVRIGFLENKQRINLSTCAYSVLLDDMSVFLPEKDLTEAGGIPSAMINNVIRNFRDTARSSISATLDTQREKLEALLPEAASDAARDPVEILMKSERDRLTNEAKDRLLEKRHSFFIRVDKDNLDYCKGPGMREAEFYKDKVGLYYKALLEEYSALPYIEREMIYKKDQVDKIRIATDPKAPLKLRLTLTSRNHAGKSNLLYMKPLRIQCDMWHQYNYLVGLTGLAGKGPWQAGCVRLSSIQECQPMSKAPIPIEKQKEIETEIQTKGVQYLSVSNEELLDLKVQFTPYGERLYRKLLRQRPMYTGRDTKTRIYSFFCTEYQAKNYFIRFGSDAKILEPQSLVDKCREWFEKALEQYEQK